MAAVGIHILWGGNPVAVKWGLEAFPPFASGFIRFTMAAVAIAAWAALRGVPLLPPREEWAPLSGLGLLFAVQIGLMNIGYGLTSGSAGAILIALNPLFAAGFAHYLMPGDRLTVLRSLGLLVAFGGTALVLTGDAGGVTLKDASLGNWLLLASAAMLGGRLIGSARVLRRLDEVRATLWMMILGLPLFAAVWMAEETVMLENLGWRPVVGILYQGLVIAGLGFMVNSYLMKRHSPTMVASFNFVSPVAGVGLSIWLLGESLSIELVGGLALVAVGLTLITRR